MKKSLKNTVLLLLAMSLTFCAKNDNPTAGDDPITPVQNSALMKELTTAQNGWKLSYAVDEVTGHYQFLLKFTAEGKVSMLSDLSATATPTTTRYTTQETKEGSVLSFVGQNYLHQLADVLQGDPAKDLSGKVYQFLYLGKEGNKLKFKNLLSNQPSQLYFEPLTATDEAQFPNLARNIVPLTEHTSHYFLKVSTATASPTLYPITFTNRVLALQGTTVKAPVKATSNGIALVPPLTIEGKIFSDLTHSGSTETPTYSATVEGITVELYYSLISPDVFNANDYLAIVNDEVSAFTYLESSFKNSAYTSKPFYDNFLAIDSEKAFNSITLRFKAGNKVDLVIGYKFPDKSSAEAITANATYEFRDKKLYMTFQSFKHPLASSSWLKPENRALLDLAFERLENLIALSSEGLYIKNTGEKQNDRFIYFFQSHSKPTFYFPAYALKKL